MRFLHTADWHIGKPLRGRSRMDEYAAALEEVARTAIAARVDAVLLAGDVFDSPAPPPEADDRRARDETRERKDQRSSTWPLDPPAPNLFGPTRHKPLFPSQTGLMLMPFGS